MPSQNKSLEVAKTLKVNDKIITSTLDVLESVKIGNKLIAHDAVINDTLEVNNNAIIKSRENNVRLYEEIHL